MRRKERWNKERRERERVRERKCTCIDNGDVIAKSWMSGPKGAVGNMDILNQ